MKKFYLSFASLAFIAGAFAQTKQAPIQTGKSVLGIHELPVHTIKNNYEEIQGKALNVLWEDDFTGSGALTTSKGTWSAMGTNSDFWTMESTVHPLGQFGYTASMNGRYLTWDSYNPITAGGENGGFSTTPVDGELISPTIDLSGASGSIGISFLTQSMYCCNFSGKPYGISFSNDDGATWSVVQSLDFKKDRNQATEDDAAPLPVSFNISSIASNFTSTCKIKIVWDGMNPDGNGQTNAHYYWLIDDFKIYEVPANDLTVKANFAESAGVSYHQVPTTQVAPIEFSVALKNSGLDGQTNVVYNVNVNSGAAQLNSPASSIAAGASDSLITNTYTPTATVATYNFASTIVADEVDDIPSDNIIKDYILDVTNFVYARDNNVLESSIANGGDPYEASLLYDIYANQTVYGLDIRFSTASEIGVEFIAKIYEFDGSQATIAEAIAAGYKGESDPMTVSATNRGIIVNVPFAGGIELEAGKTYYVAIDAGAGNTEGLRLSTCQPTNTGTCFIRDGGTYFRQVGAPIMRLNFQDKSGLEDNTNQISVSELYPNPATNATSIDFTLNVSSDVEVNVTDLTGKVVYSNSMKNQKVGKHTVEINTKEFNSGVYFVNVVSAGSTVTNKLIKK